ncbi:MAG: alanine racemase [Deltaproteobacteria bacterium]|nr:alanine racemase [Deltaproteobacteria bacterium]
MSSRVIAAGPIRPTVATVDLSALTHNLRRLRQVIGSEVGVVAVVKADAYGHGALPVARLLEGLGVRAFGVATVEEGVELRVGGVRAPVLVMGAAFGRDHRAVIDHDLCPVVGDPGDVEHFAKAASAAGRVRFGIHVKIDTGMTRLGVRAEHFAEFLRGCAAHPSIRVDGLATHFACAEIPDATRTEEQLASFRGCLEQARRMGADPQLVHAANSAAALRFPHTRFDLVRPGLVLYGARPSQEVPDLGLRPVMGLQSRINALREVPPGTPVSYCGTYVTSRSSRVATVPVGYADGYPRALSNRAEVLVRGVRCRVVGMVCMDLCMVEVTDVPAVAVGDRVTLLGGQGASAITVDDLAAWADTIPYEILSGISRRVPRTYPGLEGEGGAPGAAREAP